MTCELAYELSGPEGAPLVVLSCSLGTDRSMWAPQVARLGGHLRVLRYDLRGHGVSPVPPGPYAIADLGQDLLALLDRLSIQRASLCGVSIGGMLSMWIAAHAPERVERLVLCCTSAYFDLAATYRERAAAVRASGIEPLADAALERWFTPAFRASEPTVAASIRQALVDTPREGYAGCCEALAELDLRGELAAIEAPTLVIAGADDPATPPDQGRVIADGISHARFELLPNARHLASIERADRASELILDHLTGGPDE